MTPPAADTSISYRTELLRKGIHLSSIVIPIFYFYTPRSLALAVFIPVTLGLIAADLLRHRHEGFQAWYHRIFGSLLRKHEHSSDAKQFTGATYVLISAAVCVLIFPKLVAVISFSILIISDMMGALIGRKFGKHKFLGKSVEGSSAFFVSACIVILLTPKVDYAMAEYVIGIVAAAAGTVVEALPWKIDDNLSIPIAVGTVLWAGYALFLPALDIYKFR